MSRKRRLVDKINEEFEKLVGDKQQRQYSQYMRAINNDVVDEMPKNKKQLRKIINRHQLNPNTSIKMFSVMNGVQNLLLNPPTRESRKKLKPLEGLMRVYNVNNPKSFANAMYQMTTGQKQSDRNKRFRPLLLSYYDGFTENIETLEQQAQRAMKRAELEMQSTLFADMEELRRERLPITQVKKRLLDKYNDPKRIRRALDTELHEQAERVKLEQSKFMGYTHKKWNTQRDERVRRTKFHNQVANKVIPVDSQFKGGGIKADYPGDIDLPVGERINCRCYITYHNKPQAIPTSAPIIAPPRRRTSTQATSRTSKRKFVRGKTRDEAIANIKAIADVVYDKSFQTNADDEQTVGLTNKLGELMERFGTNSSQLKLTNTLDEFDTDAYATVPIYKGFINNKGKIEKERIEINYHINETKKENQKELIEKTRDDILKKWHVPIDDKEIKNYTTIHEYGHYVHFELIGQNPKIIEKLGNDTTKRIIDEIENIRDIVVDDFEANKDLENVKFEKKAMLELSEQLYDEIGKEIRELVDEQLAKDLNIDIGEASRIAYDQTSRYGRTNVFEWFAETFTEWQGSSSPKEHAKAFGKVVEELLKNAN